jgi:hypothetical protein
MSSAGIGPNDFISLVKDAMVKMYDDLPAGDPDDANRRPADFYGRHIPKATIKDYIKRILYYTQQSISYYEHKIEVATGANQLHATDPKKATELLAVCIATYLTRLQMKGIVLDRWNIHRLLLGAFILAYKTQMDYKLDMEWIGKVGGVSLAQANEIELSFLKLLNWKVHLNPEQIKATAIDVLKLDPAVAEDLLTYRYEVHDAVMGAPITERINLDSTVVEPKSVNNATTHSVTRQQQPQQQPQTQPQEPQQEQQQQQPPQQQPQPNPNDKRCLPPMFAAFANRLSGMFTRGPDGDQKTDGASDPNNPQPGPNGTHKNKS